MWTSKWAQHVRRTGCSWSLLRARSPEQGPFGDLPRRCALEARMFTRPSIGLLVPQKVCQRRQYPRQSPSLVHPFPAEIPNDSRSGGGQAVPLSLHAFRLDQRSRHHRSSSSSSNGGSDSGVSGGSESSSRKTPRRFRRVPQWPMCVCGGSKMKAKTVDAGRLFLWILVQHRPTWGRHRSKFSSSWTKFDRLLANIRPISARLSQIPLALTDRIWAGVLCPEVGRTRTNFDTRRPSSSKLGG